MGIFDSIGNIVRGQLIDVIEWTDSTNNTIVHKYDMNGKEIMMGAADRPREPSGDFRQRRQAGGRVPARPQ